MIFKEEKKMIIVLYGIKNYRHVNFFYMVLCLPSEQKCFPFPPSSVLQAIRESVKEREKKTDKKKKI